MHEVLSVMWEVQVVAQVDQVAQLGVHEVQRCCWSTICHVYLYYDASSKCIYSYCRFIFNLGVSSRIYINL